MADQTTTAAADDEPTAERRKRIAARQEMLTRRVPKRERVRVLPANDDMRRVLKHPSGLRFPESGSTEWPLDRFTRRRLLDGSITREDAPKPAEPKPAARPGAPPHPASRPHQ